MSNIKICYYQYHSNKVKPSPFNVDNVGYEPISLNSYKTDKKIYHECPVWTHKAKRTFLIRSPFDIDFIVDTSNGYISSNIQQQQIFDEIFLTHFSHINDTIPWFTKNSATVQMDSPSFLFWTKNKNIWIEQKSHAMTSYKNNFTSVGGWFNISSWQRPLSIAMDIVDVKKPVSIKRGDVLYEVSFYSQNQEDSFYLVKEDPSDSLINKVSSNLLVKDFVKNIGGKIALKNQESKCPFHFLWK